MTQRGPQQQWNFVVIDHPHPDREVQVTASAVTIGRLPDCDIVIERNEVAEKHCQVYAQENKLLIRDLGSGAGTFINGFPCEAQQEIMPGDLIIIGKTQVEFVGNQPIQATAAPAAGATEDDGVIRLTDVGSSQTAADCDTPFIPLGNIADGQRSDQDEQYHPFDCETDG